VRAIVQTSFGGPEVVRLQYVREPAPLPGQAAVRIAACSLNRLDALQRCSPAVIPGSKLRHIAGMDETGTVIRP
jgi:NADPH:quinone reductase-like Zn-dependent oxidoreductase